MTYTVTKPESVGIVPERLDALLNRAQREVDSGLLPSCQVAVAGNGELAAFHTFGAATNDTRYVIYSATKPIVASAIWLLMAEGRIDITKAVAEYIPEFGENGKGSVTVEQVLLHTSGFPHAPMRSPEWWERDTRLQQFKKWRLNWEPGTKYEYHPTSAHWVLAELIDRLTGEDHRQFIRTRVLDPLGLERLRLGAPADEQGDIADVVHVGEEASSDELEAVLGIRDLPVTEVTPEAITNMNKSNVRALGVPGGGAVSTAADVALFYQALLRNPGGLWDETILRDATTNVRNSLPDWRGTPANRGLGVVIAGDDGHSHFRGGFGKAGSPRRFGHDGAGGQIAWADPDTGLSFCYLTNGYDLHVIRQGKRGVALGSLAGVLADPL